MIGYYSKCLQPIAEWINFNSILLYDRYSTYKYFQNLATKKSTYMYGITTRIVRIAIYPM